MEKDRRFGARELRKRRKSSNTRADTFTLASNDNPEPEDLSIRREQHDLHNRQNKLEERETESMDQSETKTRKGKNMARLSAHYASEQLSLRKGRPPKFRGKRMLPILGCNSESEDEVDDGDKVEEQPKPSTSKDPPAEPPEPPRGERLVLRLSKHRKGSFREPDAVDEELPNKDHFCGPMRSPMRSGTTGSQQQVKHERERRELTVKTRDYDDMDIVGKARIVEELANPLLEQIDRFDPSVSGLWEDIAKYLGRKIEAKQLDMGRVVIVEERTGGFVKRRRVNVKAEERVEIESSIVDDECEVVCVRRPVKRERVSVEEIPRGDVRRIL